MFMSAGKFATGARDPFWSQVVLLANLDGNTTDLSGHRNVTLSGTSSFSTNLPPPGNTYSVRCPGGQDNVPYMAHTGDSNYTYGSGDVTIEFFFSVDTLPSTDTILYDGRLYPTDVSPVLAITPSNKVAFGASGATYITGTTTITPAQMHHIAWCKSGNSSRLFFDGVQEGATYTDNLSYIGNNNRPVFCENGTGAGYIMTGYIAKVRITHAARYTSNFTVPLTYTSK